VAWRVDGKVEYALDGGVFTAGALLEWLSGDLGLAADPPALAALAAEVEDSGGVRVLPALAGLGAPWWRSDARAVLAGIWGHAAGSHRPSGAGGDRLAGGRRAGGGLKRRRRRRSESTGA
jgi:glycerol kinase